MFGFFEFAGERGIGGSGRGEDFVVFADAFADFANFDQHFGLAFEDQEAGEGFLVRVVVPRTLRQSVGFGLRLSTSAGGPLDGGDDDHAGEGERGEYERKATGLG